MSKDYTMENLIAKYNFDMKRHEKKILRMRQLDKQGKTYDPEEIEVSDDEEEKEFMKTLDQRKAQKRKRFEDEPYKAKEEEASNLNHQLEEIQQKLDEMKQN